MRHAVEMRQRNLCQCTELVGKLEASEERVDELEAALRESVMVAIDRDIEVNTLQVGTEEQLRKMEQRIESLQNARTLKCPQCTEHLHTMNIVAGKLSQFLSHRRMALLALTDNIHQLSEQLLSELDTQVAILEASGTNTQQQVERLDLLHSNRSKLIQRLKVESEHFVELLTETTILEDELSSLLNVTQSNTQLYEFD